MRLRKISKKVFCILSLIMLGVVGSVGESHAASMKDVLWFKNPSLGSLSGDYEQQAKFATKIDGVKYESYLKFNASSSAPVRDYKDNDVWGLRIGADGSLFYAPNIDTTELTSADSSLGKQISGSKYVNNKADIYWNYAVKGSVSAATGHANKIGSFDTNKNFKPGYQKTNRQNLYPQWPKYPVQEGTSIAGDKEGEGKDLFYPDTIGTSASNAKYSGRLAWRSGVKSVVGSNTVRGEWRMNGSNKFGVSIYNPNFPKDQGDSSDTATDYRRAWDVKNPNTGYNKTTNDAEIVAAREQTYDRLKEKIDVGSLARSKYNTVFSIGVPASKHVTGTVMGYYGGSGRYVAITIPSDAVIDIGIKKMEIRDKNEVIYTMSQKTSELGVTDKTQTSTEVVKLQPGYQYTLRMEIENRADRIVYNPTFNILGAVGGNATSTSYDLLNKGSDAAAYWTYTYQTMQEKKEFGQSKKTGAGYFTVDGIRNKVVNGQKDVPSLDSSKAIAAKSSKVIDIPFTIEGANSSNLNARFGVTNPNNVRIRLAGSINKKHSISDEVFKWGGINNSKVVHSTDNLYEANDKIGMNKAFYTHDMAIGTATEYIVKDKNNQIVTSGEFIKGETYKFGIKVKNESAKFKTANKGTIDYEIKDAQSGKTISRGSAYGTRTLGTSDSEYVYFDVRIPLDASNQIIIKSELSGVHKNSKEDWYEDNNKFSRTFKAKTPVDLTLKEAMGERVGDEASPSTVKVFAGETVGLKVQVSSNVNYVVKPVTVNFSYTENGKTMIGNKNVGAVDVYNPQTVIFPYKAPNTAGTYRVEATLNPNGTIEEVDSSNNTHIFNVVVTNDLKKYATTDHVEGRKPNGAESGNSNITISEIYSSYTPSVTIQRQDTDYVYDSARDEYVEVAGPWYDYKVELPQNPLYVASSESLELKEVNFKSKYTTDRKVEGKDKISSGKTVIDSRGFVNLLGGSNATEKNEIQKLAKVKAGYGFEMEMKTEYKTDMLSKYESAIARGMETKVATSNSSTDTVSNLINQKISQLKSALPKSNFRATSKVTFFPVPQEVTINAKDQVLSVTMPDEKVYRSTERLLVEKVSGGTDNQNIAYGQGTVWNYQFTERNDGLNGKSRRYYLGNNVTNGEYYMRIGTSKLGVGGLLNADNAYDRPGKPTRLYAAKDIKIEVYGGREDDIKENR